MSAEVVPFPAPIIDAHRTRLAAAAYAALAAANPDVYPPPESFRGQVFIYRMAEAMKETGYMPRRVMRRGGRVIVDVGPLKTMINLGQP